jgi:hypothetical protein
MSSQVEDSIVGCGGHRRRLIIAPAVTAAQPTELDRAQIE